MAKSPRVRRTFDAQFKLEAVRRLEEQRARGVTLAQVGRELGVRPDVLRVWAKHATARAGARPQDFFPGQGRLSSEQRDCFDGARERTQSAFHDAGGRRADARGRRAPAYTISTPMSVSGPRSRSSGARSTVGVGGIHSLARKPPHTQCPTGP